VDGALFYYDEYVANDMSGKC